MSQIQELKKSRVHVSDFQEKSEALADGDSLRKDLMERMKAKDAVLNDLKEQVHVYKFIDICWLAECIGRRPGKFAGFPLSSLAF